MSKRKVMINIDDDLNIRWKSVSKKFRIPKSAIIEIMLERFIPILEDEKNDVLSSLMIFDTEIKKFNTVGSLFHEE